MVELMLLATFGRLILIKLALSELWGIAHTDPTPIDHCLR